MKATYPISAGGSLLFLPMEILPFGVGTGIKTTLFSQVQVWDCCKVTHAAVPELVFKHLSSDFCHEARACPGAKGRAGSEQLQRGRAEALSAVQGPPLNWGCLETGMVNTAEPQSLAAAEHHHCEQPEVEISPSMNLCCSIHQGQML